MSNTKANSNPETKRVAVSFAAIDQYLESYIVAPVEKRAPGKSMVEWGTVNRYPQYLVELYDNVTTLHTIVDGDVDFVAGDDVHLTVPSDAPHFQNETMNRKGATIREQVRDLAHDLDLFGGFALQVIRDKEGRVAELYHIPVERLRSDADNEAFWYSEDWGIRRSRKMTLVYPKFIADLDWAGLSDEEKTRHASSIFYVKNIHTRTYPMPVFAAAVKACEIERCADDYHLNAINNNFEGSAMVNFNNGTPTQEQQEEIEEEFNEKFSGHQNAGRIVFSWNANKDAATTITGIEVKDFGERYKALAEHSRQQIYCAFRAVPSLFGLPTASGFSVEEYEQAFKLYNRTRIQPMQKTIVDAYARVLGEGAVVSIVPFSLDGNNENNVQ